MSNGTRETLFWFGGIGCGLFMARHDEFSMLFGLGLVLFAILMLKPGT
jgi:hypothetical protein